MKKLTKENVTATVDMLDWKNKTVGLTVVCDADLYQMLNLSGRKVKLTIEVDDALEDL